MPRQTRKSHSAAEKVRPVITRCSTQFRLARLARERPLFSSQWGKSYTPSTNTSELSSAFFPKQINDAAIGATRMIIRLRNFPLKWLLPSCCYRAQFLCRAVGRQRPIHMPIAMTIADKAMIVRSIVSHDGICVVGCSSIALRLYPST